MTSPDTGLPDLSVLLSVYNNAATLDELLDRIVAVVEPMGLCFEIVCVDDGSRDDSFAILGRRAARDPRIRPFAMVRNYGSQAAACATFDLARAPRLVHLDADLENFPEDIPALLAPLDDGYDFVCGYRENRRGPWLTRRLPSRLLNLYVRRQTGTEIADVGCGMRAFDAGLVRDLASEGEGRRLLTPLLLRRARRVAQVPVRHDPRPRRGGHSVLTLLGVALDYWMLTAGRVFLVAGLVALGVVGLGLGVLVAGGVVPGLVLIVGGLLGGLLALLGEYVQRIYQLGQNVPFYKLREPGPPRD
jgi:glycosyltransferase involved in cell wall biosynthesis